MLCIYGYAFGEKMKTLLDEPEVPPGREPSLIDGRGNVALFLPSCTSPLLRNGGEGTFLAHSDPFPRNGGKGKNSCSLSLWERAGVRDF